MGGDVVQERPSSIEDGKRRGPEQEGGAARTEPGEPQPPAEREHQRSAHEGGDQHALVTEVGRRVVPVEPCAFLLTDILLYYCSYTDERDHPRGSGLAAWSLPSTQCE